MCEEMCEPILSKFGGGLYLRYPKIYLLYCNRYYTGSGFSLHEVRKMIIVVARAASYVGGWSGFPDIVMKKKIAFRIIHILDVNECQNKLLLGCSTIHALFLLTG